jgi:cobalt-zinc-cadmium efflux system outer membrane protein
MLPYPGKRGLRGQIASKEADASQWDVEAIRRRVAADVKAAYYDYWFYGKAIQTTQRNHELLTKLSRIAEVRYRVGKGIQPDVLRSQVEISLMLQKLTTLKQMRATAQARLNTLHHMIGSRPKSMQATVITFGRRRLTAPFTMDSRRSSQMR